MLNNIRRYFITGIIVILPLFLSLYILFILFLFVDGILGKFINVYFKDKFGFYIPGLGLILLILIIIIVGFLSTYLLGKRLYNLTDRISRRIPLVKNIYPSIKQVFEFLFYKKSAGFRKVVLVHYPTKNSWTIGFITNDYFEEGSKKTDQELISVFVPLSPNPISGFLIFVPKKEAIVLDISIEEAMKLVVSGGLLNPAVLKQTENRK